jgi:hypothetical protein
LVFTVSNIQHGYFALTSNPSSAITSFTQAQVDGGEVEFVPDGGPLAPSYSVSVSDPYSTTAPATAAIKFIPTPTQEPIVASGNSNTTRNAIIGATVSGAIGLLFLVLKLYLTHRATKNLQQLLAGEESDTEKKQAAFHKEVIRPIANKIFDRIKTSSFLGYRSDQDTRAYISAIETLISQLKNQDVDLHIVAMNAAAQNELLNEIAKQTRKMTVSSRRCSTVISFFKPEATPQQIEDKADAIAIAVQTAINQRSAKGSKDLIDPMAEDSVELADISLSH